MMKNRINNKALKRVCVCIVLMLVLFTVVALSSLDMQRQKQIYKVVLVPKTIDAKNGFWTSLIEGCQLGADEYGVDLQVLGGQSEEDVVGQIKRIEDSIKDKPDVMIVAPCSYSETSGVLKKIIDSGIKLILIDSVIDQDIADGVVATDNYLAGQSLGEYAKDLLTEYTEIGIVGHVQGTSTAIEREKGIRDGLGPYEEQVKDVVFCGSSYEKAYSLTLTLLTDYPNMGMIMGTNEYSAVGAARAVKEKGLAGQVKVVGFDNSVEEIQFLEEGVFQGIVIQKPFNMGYLGLKQAVSIADGKKIKKNVNSGCKLITRDNMYEDENQRLLYPFTGQQ